MAESLEKVNRNGSFHYNHTAERAVISAILVENNCFEDAWSVVRPMHFHDTAVRWIYQTVWALARDGRGIDSVSLAESLMRTQRHSRFDCVSKLRAILEESGDPRHVREYGRIIVEHWEARKVEPEPIAPVNSGKSGYEGYLTSDAWKAKAEAMKWIAGYRCQACNIHRDDAILDTHHRTYERLGHEEPGDLIVLCRKCHQIFHDNGQLAKPPRR